MQSKESFLGQIRNGCLRTQKSKEKAGDGFFPAAQRRFKGRYVAVSPASDEFAVVVSHAVAHLDCILNDRAVAKTTKKIWVGWRVVGGGWWVVGGGWRVAGGGWRVAGRSPPILHPPPSTFHPPSSTLHTPPYPTGRIEILSVTYPEQPSLPIAAELAFGWRWFLTGKMPANPTI